ncbi:MAG: hypothetical protein SOZ90_04575 [Candidatus Faecousia sp.]|nr:hypothetical protein [Candidatus Faecousia sp.]
MKKNILWILWSGAYVLCAALGFLPERSSGLQAFLTVLSLGFFVPPALLLIGAYREKSPKTIRLVRTVSALSLGLTVLALIFNIVFASGSAALGNFLHGLLVLVSAPMLCMDYWALSLFLWACLLFGSLKKSFPSGEAGSA